MKRRAVLLIITVAMVASFGALLHSPPSLVDAISGATKKSYQVIMAVAPNEYILAINTKNGSLTGIARALDCGEQFTGIAVCISASDDSFTKKRAELLAEQLREAGIEVEINTYSETMLFSRALAGKYDLLFYPGGSDAPEIPGAELIVIPGKVAE